jgi:hypothetical protein
MANRTSEASFRVVSLFLQLLDSKEILAGTGNWTFWNWEPELNKAKVESFSSHISTHLSAYYILSKFPSTGEIEGWLFSHFRLSCFLLFSPFALGTWRFGRVQYQR